MKKPELAMLDRDGFPFEVRVMARAEGYAMVRRKGCLPFVVSVTQLTPITNNPDHPTT